MNTEKDCRSVDSKYCTILNFLLYILGKPCSKYKIEVKAKNVIGRAEAAKQNVRKTYLSFLSVDAATKHIVVCQFPRSVKEFSFLDNLTMR